MLDPVDASAYVGVHFAYLRGAEEWDGHGDSSKADQYATQPMSVVYLVYINPM
jgi:hypothetical protein